MNRLDRINEIYNSAVDLPPAEQAAYLDVACAGDQDLRHEVESLLSFDEEAGSFIEMPPGDIVAAALASNRERELAGKTLGPYKIVAPLGSGGMGEVFVATDERLGRSVALKLMPREFSADEERRLRFEREARAASALNHPNIITIFGTERFDGIHCIVSELIEGVTLRQLIAEKPPEWREAVRIVGQVADALDAAHKVGVVHRDIKPPNIMVRPDGLVKVLDFGLAKLVRADGDAHFETRDLTGESRVMGTISYMSPEQMLGEKVDERSDIYSLGVVLYEVLTGVRPFSGASDAAIYNAAINHTPESLTALRPEIPPALEQIVLHALEKKRENRYQTVAEMRGDLLALEGDSSIRLAFANPSARSRLPAVTGIAVAFAVLATVAAGIYFALRTPKGVVAVNREFNYSQLTRSDSEELYPGLLPDGTGLIYSSPESGNWDIYLLKFDSPNAINLTSDNAADDREPMISGDGSTIVFRSERDGGGIYLMNTDGSELRRVLDSGFNPALSPDGKSIAFGTDDIDDPSNRSLVDSRIGILDLATGEKRILPSGDGVQPKWSPDGRRIAFWGIRSGGSRDILTIAADGGEPVAVTADEFVDWNPVWAPDGRSLYFVSDRSGSMNLWNVAIDSGTGSPRGSPEAVTIPAQYSQLFDFSKDGRKFAYVQSTINVNIRSIEFDPVAEKFVGAPVSIVGGSRVSTNPRVSTDGKRIVFDSVGGVKENIFTVGVDGSNMRQLTNDSFKNRAPTFSPDGSRIAYFSDRTGNYQGWIMNTDGSDGKQITQFGEDDGAQWPIWSPDGRRLMFSTFKPAPAIFQVTDSPTPQPGVSVGSNAPFEWFLATSWSPDGRRVVGMGRKPNEPFSSVAVLDIESGKFGEPVHTGSRPVWLSDSRRFLFFHGRKVFIHDTATGRTKELMTMPGDGLQSLNLAADDRKLIFSVKRIESDIWLATEK